MPLQDVRIAALTPDTVAALDRIAEDVFDAPIDPVQLDAFLADPRHLLWFAEADGEIIGFASASELLHPDKPPQLFINEVGVAPAWRRKGIGRALVTSLVEAARARGCSYAWLGTATDNVGGNACFGSVPGVEKAETFVVYEWEIGQD